MAYFSPQLDPASTADHLLLHGQEFHTSYWGHLGLLNLTRNFILPGYAAYPNTAAASLYPANANVADMRMSRARWLDMCIPLTVSDPAKDASLTAELPADVALGKVDYIEVVGFSDHKSTAEVWYKLLNCGFGCRRLQERTSWATTRRCADRWAEPRICGGETRTAED